MVEKNAVQLKDLFFSGKYHISIMNFLIELKRAWDSSHIHEGTPVWLLWYFMTGPALDATKARLALSLKDVNMQKAP